jgi:quinol monooxygenase YgiN
MNNHANNHTNNHFMRPGNPGNLSANVTASNIDTNTFYTYERWQQIQQHNKDKYDSR